jgi:alcohol dehydrogenase (cytochrome c)
VLRNPSASDWLHWRRTYDSWGYSPLTQVNRQTVRQLQLAWSWTMEPGSQQPTPLVYDGVMYLPNAGNVVHALDAATGDLLWEYRYQPPNLQERASPAGANARPVRSLALAGDNVFMTTPDARVVALNARTGAVAWNVQVADPAQGFTLAAAPVAIPGGKIVVSLSGCGRYIKEKCSIIALSAASGQELWRTATVALPGEPGGDTWGDLPPAFRAGTEMWMAGTYDPDLNLVLWATAQAKPWARFQRGTDGDALYSTTTLALDPDSGKIVWYRQLIPGETQDMDEVFENILVDVGSQRSIFKMGKLGILWQLDRKTGKHQAAHDIGYQNIVRVNPQTGAVAYRPEAIPQPETELEFCPDLAGFRAQWSMSYSPETRAFYIPLELVCAKAVFSSPNPRVEGRSGSGGAKRQFVLHPSAGNNLGEFLALDVNGKVLWRRRQRPTMMSAALTTAGGLAFGWR